MALSLSCTNDEKILVTATPRTAKGKARPLDGPVTVTVVSGTGTFEMVSDATFFVSAVDAGVTEYKVDAVSTGISLSNTASLNVSEAPPVALDLTGDAPIPQS